jgi:hypothetical protein
MALGIVSDRNAAFSSRPLQLVSLPISIRIIGRFRHPVIDRYWSKNMHRPKNRFNPDRRNDSKGCEIMASARRKLGNMGSWLLAASALSGGCLSFCHSTGQPPPEQSSACHAVPPGCRNHVYVFFIQGIDPLSVSNLEGVRDYVQALGFIKTYYGYLYHAGTIAKEIRRLHGEDEQAHFVLIGYNLGANRVRDVANAVRSDGIFVDLIVYLGGHTMEKVPEMKPENVGHVVNILTKDWLGDGPVLNDATNVTYTDVSFFGAPTHHYTLETLAHELTAIAEMVPVVELLPTPPVELAPVPKMPRASAPRDEWDFLKPRSPYGEQAAPTTTPAKPSPRETVPPSSVGRI